jgi:hypothetical protein
LDRELSTPISNKREKQLQQKLNYPTKKIEFMLQGIPPIQHSLLDAAMPTTAKKVTPKEKPLVLDNPYQEEEDLVLDNFAKNNNEKYAISLLSSR